MFFILFFLSIISSYQFGFSNYIESSESSESRESSELSESCDSTESIDNHPCEKSQHSHDEPSVFDDFSEFTELTDPDTFNVDYHNDKKFVPNNITDITYLTYYDINNFCASWDNYIIKLSSIISTFSIIGLLLLFFPSLFCTLNVSIVVIFILLSSIIFNFDRNDIYVPAVLNCNSTATKQYLLSLTCDIRCYRFENLDSISNFNNCVPGWHHEMINTHCNSLCDNNPNYIQQCIYNKIDTSYNVKVDFNLLFPINKISSILNIHNQTYSYVRMHINHQVEILPKCKSDMTYVYYRTSYDIRNIVELINIVDYETAHLLLKISYSLLFFLFARFSFYFPCSSDNFFPNKYYDLSDNSDKSDKSIKSSKLNQSFISCNFSEFLAITTYFMLSFSFGAFGAFYAYTSVQILMNLFTYFN
jgi:hypothetical protein